MPSAILRPNAVGSHGSGWSLVGAASKQLAVDPGDPISHDDATSYLRVGFPDSVGQSLAYENLTTKAPSAKEIVEVRRYARIRRTSNVETNPEKLAAVIHRVATDTTLGGPEGTPGEAATAFYGPDFIDFSFPVLNPESGSQGKWDLDAADRIESFDQRTDDDAPSEFVDMTSSWYVVQYIESVTTVQGADEAAARRLIRTRHPIERYRQNCGPRAELADFADAVQFIEPFGPDAEGRGFGSEEWERRLLIPLRKTIDLDTSAVTLEAEDPREWLTTFFLQGKSDAPGSKAGAVLFNNGNVETFSRADEAWLEWADGNVYEIAAGAKKWTYRGLLLERGRTNRLRNSAFHVDGGGGGDIFANWAETNSAQISAQTGSPLFHVSVSKQYARLTRAAGVGGILTAVTPSSIGASLWVAVSVFHQDTGNNLRLDIQNNATGNWINLSTGSWVGTRPGNDLTLRSTRTRDTVVFQMEGTGGTLDFRLAAEKSDGQINDIWQCDLIDDIDFETSPIVTYSAEVAQPVDALSYAQGLDQEAVPVDGSQYTIQATVVPRFSSSTVAHPQYGGLGNLGSGVWTVEQGSFANSRVWFDINGGSNLRLAMNVQNFGLPDARLEDLTWNAYDRIAILFRVSSSRGEHDLGANEAHMMARNLTQDGPWHETTYEPVTALDPTSSSIFRPGQMKGSSATVPLNGFLEYLNVRPYVLPVAEGKGFP